MNLIEAYKEVIKENHKLEYGCVMAILPVNKDSWAELLDMIDPEDVYGKDGEFGRELEPHVTVLFGLHADTPDEAVEKIISGFKPPTIKMANITSFSNENFDVLKFDVESPELHKCHEALSELPNSDEFSEYYPHATIAYLKKGAAEKYHGKLADPYEVVSKTMKYSKTDGKQKFYNIA